MPGPFCYLACRQPCWRVMGEQSPGHWKGAVWKVLGAIVAAASCTRSQHLKSGRASRPCGRGSWTGCRPRGTCSRTRSLSRQRPRARRLCWRIIDERTGKRVTRRSRQLTSRPASLLGSARVADRDRLHAELAHRLTARKSVRGRAQPRRRCGLRAGVPVTLRALTDHYRDRCHSAKHLRS